MLYSPSPSVLVQPNALYPTSAPYSSAPTPQAIVPSNPIAAPATNITINNIFASLCSGAAQPPSTPKADSYTPSNVLYANCPTPQPQQPVYTPPPMPTMPANISYTPPPMPTAPANMTYTPPPMPTAPANMTYTPPPMPTMPAPVAYSPAPVANPLVCPTSPMPNAADMNNYLSTPVPAAQAQAGYCPPMTAYLTPTPGTVTPTPTAYTPTGNPPSPTPSSCPPTPTPGVYPPPGSYTPTPTPGLNPPTPTPCPPTTPVAEKKHSAMWGDPHVDTASGGKYDFQKIGFYNVLSDKNINLNAKLDGEQGKPTFITEAGLKLGTHQLDVKSDGSAQLGSGSSAIVLKDGQSVILDDGSTIAMKGSVVTADTPEYKIKFETGKMGSTINHINVSVDSKAGGVMADGLAPTGLLGEGFSKTKGKQNAAILDESTYQRTDLFDTSTNAATQQLAQKNLNEAIAASPPPAPATQPNPTQPGTAPAGSAPAGSVPAGTTPVGSLPAGSLPTGSLPATGGNSTGITMLLKMMTMMSQMLRVMMQLFGQGNQLAA